MSCQAAPPFRLTNWLLLPRTKRTRSGSDVARMGFRWESRRAGAMTESRTPWHAITSVASKEGRFVLIRVLHA